MNAGSCPGKPVFDVELVPGDYLAVVRRGQFAMAFDIYQAEFFCDAIGWPQVLGNLDAGLFVVLLRCHRAQIQLQTPVYFKEHFSLLVPPLN